MHCIIKWTNDDTTFHFSVFDTNGTVDSMLINWGDGSTNNLSIHAKTKIDSTRHKYPVVNKDSVFIRKVTLIDNDTISSITIDSVLVKVGRPKVWAGNSTDTLFLPVTNAGNYVIRAHANDSNGTLKKFYWSFSTPFSLISADSTADSSVTHYISTNDINTGYQMAVFGKDDDGIIGADTFFLYPDGPPPAPDTVSPIKNTVIPNGTSVTLQWKNEDKHDKANTLFQVIYWTDQTDSVKVGFKPGTDYVIQTTNNINYYSCTFTPTFPSTKVVFWKVIAKDMLGAEKSSADSYFIYSH